MSEEHRRNSRKCWEIISSQHGVMSCPRSPVFVEVVEYSSILIVRYNQANKTALMLMKKQTFFQGLGYKLWDFRVLSKSHAPLNSYYIHRSHANVSKYAWFYFYVPVCLIKIVPTLTADHSLCWHEMTIFIYL